jgi:hypothetical protein
VLSEKSLLIRPETSEVVASDGRSQKIDLLIGIPPHQAPEVVRSSEPLGVSGFIHADVADPADRPRRRLRDRRRGGGQASER